MLKPSPNLAVSVSCKYDLANLIEFIEYHRLVGVNKIYICNNDINPILTERVLRPYIENGFVNHTHSAFMFGRTNNRQTAAHQYVLGLARKHKVKWLSMLDMDEFLYPVQYDTVTEVLKDYDKCGVLQVSYACFGSSNYVHKQMLQTNSYIRRAKHNWFWNHLSKSIGLVDRIGSCSHHHCFTPIAPFPMIDEDKKRLTHWVHPPGHKHLRINHYLSRSKEDYRDKIKRGNPIGERRDWRWFSWADRNEVFDDGMRRFVPKLLEALEGNKSWYASKGLIKLI